MPNRRDYPRHLKRLRVRFRDEEAGKWRQSFTYDISVSGVFVRSTRIPRVDRIELEVELDGAEPVPLSGRLIHGMRVPPQLLRTVQVKGGFAVQLLEAPPAWYEFCLALGRRQREARPSVHG